jgi:uncharacterized membrane protein
LSEPSNDILRWFRRSFLSGVAIVLPFAVTIWLIALFVSIVDNNVLPLLPQAFRETAERVPGAGIMVAIVAITVVGALAANFFGRFIVRETEDLVQRLPVIRSIYGGTKQVFNQVTSKEKQSFKEAVLIEFPQAGYWAIGFVTNESPDLAPDGYVAVYIAQSPIPTSGFLVYAPRNALRPLPIGPEEALKRVISLGAAQGAGNGAVTDSSSRP